MFKFGLTSASKKDTGNTVGAQQLLETIRRTQAMIQFEPDGTIIDANDNFLFALGYRLDEIKGKHHSIFVDDTYREGPEYAAFWKALSSGEAFSDQFPRIAKDGTTIWIQATYAPVLNEAGEVMQVMKIATDITQRRRDLEAIAESLEALSQGDLCHEFPLSEVEDLRSIGMSLHKASRELRASLATAQDISQAVERTARDVSQASSELAHRTESQAATLVQTAAAIEELTATVRQSAEGATEVERAAQNAKSTAEAGGKVVSDAVSAMSRIEQSSERIAQIISVIDDIAFQTNLLALNAGVEAARAGEAGRGFAVVASEVRALAQRASDAAGEIKLLITESGSHVEQGVTLVNHAGGELDKIIAVVSEIFNSISHIAHGTSEQAVTLNEINSGVSQLDAVTQQNAAMVEETTASGQALADDASRLAEQVSRFRVSNDRPATRNERAA